MPPQRILVTGSSGFIGGHLVRLLKDQLPAATVIGLDRHANSDVPCDEFVRLDLLDAGSERAVALCAADAAFHLAALCKEPGYPWRDYFEVNHVGTERLLRGLDASNTKNIIFTSTMMVFAPGRFCRSEQDFLDPDTAYGASKALAEQCVLAWQRGGPSRRARIVRPGVVFGPNDVGNMPRLIEALRKRRFAYIARRDTVKGCIYVKDLADLLMRMLDDDAEHTTYHAVYRQPTTIQQIVDAICTAWDIRRNPMTVPYSVALALASPFAVIDPFGTRFGIHPRRIQKLFADTHIAANRLDALRWQPRFSLEDAFRDWKEESAGR